MAKTRQAAAPGDDRDAAQRHRDRMAENSRNNFSKAAELGELEAVVDPKRKAACKKSLLKFLQVYFPGTTGLSPFSEDHKRVIRRLERAIRTGGRSFNLVYRGFAKTTISVNAVLWAMLYGYRRLIVLVGASRDAGKELLDAIKAELEGNELLAEDFPEVCQAIEALEGKVQRCASQTYKGELTGIGWTKDRIVFPKIEGSDASGSSVVTRGITSQIRGIGKRGKKQQRPDLVICDDLQTDASAASKGQVKKRLGILSKSILKLAGHSSTIACVVNGTIIERDDLMDRLRDPLQYPGWQGETVKMVRAWSDAHETLWLGDYARLRRSFDPADPDDQARAHAAANAFYLANRKAMDAGCLVSWASCYDPENEHSAIQHAYNFLIDDGQEVFACECQSEPMADGNEAEQLRAADIIHKLSGLARYEVPANTFRLTCYIDTQDESFWYVVVAWSTDFTGYVVDYGAWPDQRSLDASKKALRVKLSDQYAELKNREPRWRAGLADLCDAVLGRDYLDADGRSHAITAAFVDTADGDSSLPIRNWVRSSKRWSKILRCSMGIGLRPADTPFGERKKADDEIRRGLNWIEKKDKKVPGGSITWIDANWWKTFLANRWRAGSPWSPKLGDDFRPAEPGAIYLWGTDAQTHQTFGVHNTAEYATRLEHKKSGRSIDFWELKPNRPDNEWFDGTVGCCVLADLAGGVSLKNAGLKTVVKRKPRRSRQATPLSL